MAWFCCHMSKIQFAVIILISVIAFESVFMLFSVNIDQIPKHAPMTSVDLSLSSVHYKHEWQHLTHTNWSIPVIPRSNVKKWKYDIINYPILPFFLKSNKIRAHNIITIVTQCSLDRLYMIRIIANHWNGAISLAIYIPHNISIPDIKHNISLFWNEIEEHTSTTLDIHLLFESFTEQQIVDAGYFALLYPVNHLRNIALQCAQTEYVLLIDGDFIPSDNFMELAIQNYNDAFQMVRDYKYNEWKALFTNITATNNSNITDILPQLVQFEQISTDITRNNMALIVPVFELNLPKNGQWSYNGTILDKVPATKHEMVASYNNGSSVWFHQKICGACHYRSNYAKWINPNTNAPYRIDYRRSYEPYIMVKRVGIHRYDARFRGYGLNKIMHMYALNDLDDYHWMVSSDCFLYHIPHNRTRDRMLFSKHRKKRGNWLSGLVSMAKKELKAKIDASGYIIA